MVLTVSISAVVTQRIGFDSQTPVPKAKACFYPSSEQRRCLTTIPAALQAALDGFIALFNALLAVVIGILFPATPTALSLIADFGLMVALVFATIAVVKKFTNW